MDASIAMIAITTRSSISVKALLEFFNLMSPGIVI
jgi:hypothetical protein